MGICVYVSRLFPGMLAEISSESDCIEVYTVRLSAYAAGLSNTAQDMQWDTLNSLSQS